MKRYHLYISGRVQGVWYRQSMLQEAVKLGVSGWVKNLIDGRVEACIEGDDASTKKLIEWCYKGPPKAIVENVEIREEPYKGDFKTFQILY